MVIQAKTAWLVVERGTTVAALIASLAVIAVQFEKPRTAQKAPIVPRGPLSLDNAPTIGNTAAARVLMVYSDFQCPYCARFAQETWPQLREQYVDRGMLLVAFRNLPLPIHAQAIRAAEAAECANREGKFWEMHDRLFQDQQHLDDATFLRDAGELGLDLDRWGACYRGEARAHIESDISDARAVGISSTPYFVLGSRMADGSLKALTSIRGSMSLETFQRAIDGLR